MPSVKMEKIVEKMKAAGAEIREFKKAEPVDSKEVFGIFDMAMRDGKRAVQMVRLYY